MTGRTPSRLEFAAPATALLIAVALVVHATDARAAWQPGPAIYGIGQQLDQEIQMADGVVLRADVYFPTDLASGQAALGPFPVLVLQTPYTKSGGHYTATYATAPGTASNQIGEIPYAIQRGYINVVADVRGSGDSGGTWGLFDPVMQDDGARVVRWAAGLPHSNGNVGLYGPSYMGIMQFLTIKGLGADCPVKAMVPIVAANNIYRDAAFMGGMPTIEFEAAYMALMAGLNTGSPFFEHYNDPVGALGIAAEHAPGLLATQVGLSAEIVSGGDPAYDQVYWQAREPRRMLQDVVAAGVPALIVGGWYDLFQRGEPLNYSGLQNAYAGAAVGAPMLPQQAATGRYQLVMGPWYHVTGGTGIDFYRLELAWFDRWLKGVDTGIDVTTTPAHLFALGANRWVDVSHYPFDHLAPTILYLAGGPSGSGAPSTNDGRLTTSKPSSDTGADPVAFTAASSSCSRQTEQWGAGLVELAVTDPCTTDDRSLQAGPGALTYTTDPFPEDTMIGGPIAAAIYLTSTRPEVELEATLEDVAPGGTSLPLTSGALAGSFRALDQDQSWFAADGTPMLPYHPYTKASLQAVPDDMATVTRLDIEIYPTLAQIAQGHRLRLTLNTSDTPHLSPTGQQLPNLVGAIYQVQRNAAAASFLEVPTGKPSDFPPSTLVGLPGF